MDGLRDLTGISTSANSFETDLGSFNPKFPLSWRERVGVRGPPRYVTFDRSVASSLQDWAPLRSEMFRLAEKF